MHLAGAVDAEFTALAKQRPTASAADLVIHAGDEQQCPEPVGKSNAPGSERRRSTLPEEKR